MRGAWIEIRYDQPELQDGNRSPPVRGAWIEIYKAAGEADILASPPVRGAWIEIETFTVLNYDAPVASREGGVD